MNNYTIGDIVLADYLTFNKDIKTGMFLIYAIDKRKSTDSFQTYSVLKISTEPGSFQLKLDSNYYKFLHYDSYVNSNTSQKLGSTQITSRLGSINSYTMSVIKKQMKHYMREVYNELDKFIEEDHKETLNYSVNPNNDSITNDSVITIDGQQIPLKTLVQIINKATQS